MRATAMRMDAAAGASVPTGIDSTFAINTVAPIGNTIAINVPSTTQNGDMLILFIWAACAVCTGSFVISTPAGWTLLATNISGPVTNGVGRYSRMASSEPASYTLTVTGPTTTNFFAVMYRVQGATIVGNHSGTATTLTAPSISPAAPSTLLYSCGQVIAGANTWTPPTGMIEDVDQDALTTTITGTADNQSVAAGATGSRTATPSAGAGTMQGAQMVAVR